MRPWRSSGSVGQFVTVEIARSDDRHFTLALINADAAIEYIRRLTPPDNIGLFFGFKP